MLNYLLSFKLLLILAKFVCFHLVLFICLFVYSFIYCNLLACAMIVNVICKRHLKQFNCKNYQYLLFELDNEATIASEQAFCGLEILTFIEHP